MISVFMISPQEMQQKIVLNAKAKRLELNLTQQTLASMSGVSYGVLKKFERSGEISLKSLLKLALTLGSIDGFNELFAPDKPEQKLSLDELMLDTTRKRGRK